ncbi:melanoma-associated antigen 4-like [Sorex fumeus]|uniref:melanoma-associated antigen 4-like n=1 Tax=Sorex fumeus TaxID=62283 RepID=UPI0024AD3241|nr:melanoma-associated antigen 4-like [Sorex fumeus]
MSSHKENLACKLEEDSQEPEQDQGPRCGQHSEAMEEEDTNSCCSFCFFPCGTYFSFSSVSTELESFEEEGATDLAPFDLPSSPLMPDPMWQQLSKEDSASSQGDDGQDGEELMESPEDEWQVSWQMHNDESSSSSEHEWMALWQMQGDSTSIQEGKWMAEEESYGQEEAGTWLELGECSSNQREEGEEFEEGEEAEAEEGDMSEEEEEETEEEKWEMADEEDGEMSEEEEGEMAGEEEEDTEEEEGEIVEEEEEDTEEEGQGDGEGSESEDSGDSGPSLLQEALQEKMLDVVKFLLLKYRSKEVVSKKEIVRNFLRHYPALFPIIFTNSREYLQLVFGIEVQDVVASRSFMMVPCLGLTYDGLENPEQIMPKTGLLVMVLGIIFLAGDRIMEEDLWNVLVLMGVYPDTEHYIFGHPRELLTNVLVREQYLDYRHTPGNPGRHQFLWGPRAYAETSRWEVLKFLLKVTKSESEDSSSDESESDGEEGARGE